MLFFASALLGAVSAIRFTGDVRDDFRGNLFNDNEALIIPVQDPSIDKDVGVPSGLAAIGLDTSGWDIDTIYFQYEAQQDFMNIGIDCFVICGDADGDGDEGRTSDALRRLGGLDRADLSGEEAFAISFDWEQTGSSPDSIMGVPSGSLGAFAQFECDEFSLVDCFGIYDRVDLPGVGPGFLFQRNNGPQFTANLASPKTSPQQPDLEWQIRQFSNFKTFTRTDRENEEFSFYIQAFAGSFVDAGIGEDFLPDNTNFIEVPFLCQNRDVCDVCNGDGRSCLDCCGVPNGFCEYDRCDVCDGDGTSCLDCLGVPFGNNDYDECDVCAGLGNSCLDCCGIPNGPCEYDVCDECEGDGRACLECEWVFLCRSPFPHDTPFTKRDAADDRIPMLANGDVEPTRESAEGIFARFDADQDGQLSQEEFLQMMNL